MRFLRLTQAYNGEYAIVNVAAIESVTETDVPDFAAIGNGADVDATRKGTLLHFGPGNESAFAVRERFEWIASQLGCPEER